MGNTAYAYGNRGLRMNLKSGLYMQNNFQKPEVDAYVRDYGSDEMYPNSNIKIKPNLYSNKISSGRDRNNIKYTSKSAF
jgi:hypothetical protein